MPLRYAEIGDHKEFIFNNIFLVSFCVPLGPWWEKNTGIYIKPISNENNQDYKPDILAFVFN
jgi:hypothetical protein